MERLIKFLSDKAIETHVLVVNRIMAQPTEARCKFCSKRYRMEQKYLADIHDLYDDFRVAETAIQEDEVKGVEAASGSARFVAPLFSAG
jgi:arsenite-transporting ATPase